MVAGLPFFRVPMVGIPIMMDAYHRDGLSGLAVGVLSPFVAIDGG